MNDVVVVSKYVEHQIFQLKSLSSAKHSCTWSGRCTALHVFYHAEDLCHKSRCHYPWSQNGVVPLGPGGPPSQVWEEGNLGYEPTRDLPAGGDLGVGLQLEEAMFPTTIR